MKNFILLLLPITILFSGCINKQNVEIQNNSTTKTESADIKTNTKTTDKEWPPTIQEMAEAEQKQEQECENIENIIKDAIDKTNHCTTDSDCILLTNQIYHDCNFGGFHFVNKNENFLEILKTRDRYYDELNCEKCAANYDSDPGPNEIECINNKCVFTR